MNIPPPGVIRNPGPNLYETLYQPFDGPLDFLTPDVELPKHVQEVVGQNPHLQPGLVGLETMATGLVPAQGVLALLDPVLDIAPAIVDLDQLRPVEPGIGHDEANPREQLTLMPFDFADNPAGLAPALGLVVKVDDLDLDAALGRTTNRASEVGLNEPPQVLIRTKSDEVGDPLLLTVLVDIWTGKGSVTTKPKELEPWTVTLHYGTDELKNTIG